MQTNTRMAQGEAEDLGREMQRLASAQAGLDHDFCALVARFDEGEGIGWFQGLKTTAHFLAFACSMSPAVAREHVRVARALRSMPATDGLFAQGRLSYSKVRELTRLAGQVAEEGLLSLALEMTASQLARTVSSYRTAAGTRIRSAAKRSFTLTPTGDGMARLSVCLPAEEAALVTAAIEAATRRGAPTPDHDDQAADALVCVPAGTPGIDRVQALVDIAASYLEALPGKPADDHTLVIVQVSVDQLASIPDPAAEREQHVPAEPSRPSDAAADVPPESPTTASDAAAYVPTESAATAEGAARRLRAGTCHVVGHGPIEAATAQRLSCTGRLVGAVVDKHGDVLALGRTKRLASRAQRRALLVRDHGVCQFPGCHQAHHLEAHHLHPWASGGTTDLANLLLLCRRHHTIVHEGGVRVSVAPQSRERFHFALPGGQPISGTWRARWSAEELEDVLASDTGGASHETDGPARIAAAHGGVGFSLEECVRVLFDCQVPPLIPDAAATGIGERRAA